MFYLDPLEVLNADQEEWLIRLAAHLVVMSDMEKQNKKK